MKNLLTGLAVMAVIALMALFVVTWPKFTTIFLIILFGLIVAYAIGAAINDDDDSWGPYDGW